MRALIEGRIADQFVPALLRVPELQIQLSPKSGRALPPTPPKVQLPLEFQGHSYLRMPGGPNTYAMKPIPAA